MVTEQTEYAAGGYVSPPKPGDPPLLPDYDRCHNWRYVDHGIRIPRGDVQVVLLDAVPIPADLKRALDQISALFDHRNEKQR